MREIRRIYGEYFDETGRAAMNKKATDGLMGFTKGPSADPCHDRFSEQLKQTLEAFAAAPPSSQDVEEVLRYIYDTPVAYKDNTLVYLMLQAVHAHTEKLIAFLSTEDAAGLAARYIETYPRSVRLPVQNKIVKLLQAQAGQSDVRKGGILNIFKRRESSR
ncbi:hypothetical protein SAMN02745823_03665 [Sporobacter termitidis DSM 10068]|uniref:Uncharacterized protein n=2 Tax=Sporobacter TaxID=44748 RepID=A0A1M5ZFI2_9FIRM|nr:hypothetical protein SAMN02745823_03665 [Sporobacter termitidis DSM 10068]